MPTERLDDDCFSHNYFWEKHRDKALQRFLDVGHDPQDVGLIFERVEMDRYHLHWKHRCPDCNECRPFDYNWCKICEVLHFRHDFVEDMYFLTDKLAGDIFRVIFYLKSQKRS